VGANVQPTSHKKALLSAVSTYAALRVALRGVASVASLVATSCRVVALHVAARCWLRVALRCVGHHVFYW